MNQLSKSYFLFSVDLEDLRRLADEGDKVGERLPILVDMYLDFLDRNKKKCTFFVVGETARDYPEIIKKIYTNGHEIACHTDRHIPLTEHTPQSFEKDLQENVKSIVSLGIPAPIGFRAPSLSLTHSVKWVYPILKRNGFMYSSSVLPAPNPLYGWPGFGEKPKRVEGVLEIPITLSTFSIGKVPIGAGIYFRTLPDFLVHHFFSRKAKLGQDVIGYFHPYDIDVDQPKVMHPGINKNRFYNFLMYYNRKGLFSRVEKRMAQGFDIVSYKDYLDFKKL